MCLSPSNDTFFPSVVNIYSEKKRETIWLKCCHSMLSFHPLNIIFYLVFPIRIHIFRIDIAKWVLSLYLPHKSASLIFSIEIKLWEEVVKLPSYSYQKNAMLRARILSFLNFNLNISWNFFEGKLSSLSKCSFEGWCCCCGCCKWAIFMNFTRYIKQTDKLDGIGYILRSKKFFFFLME